MADRGGTHDQFDGSFKTAGARAECLARLRPVQVGFGKSMTMADATPDPTPNTPEPPQAPDGWELACMGILRSEFGRRHTDALDKAMMQLSAEQAWMEDRAEVAQAAGWRRWLGVFLGWPIGRVAFGLAMMAAIAVAAWM